MIKLKKPKLNQCDIYDDCINNIRSYERKARLENSKDEVISKSSEYDLLAQNEKLCLIPEHVNVQGGVNKDDMVFVYENKFSKKGQIARKYYDEIMLSAPYGRCPLCGQRQVKTLDHYLPKSKFPTYSITPFNLIPACSDCNKDKTDDIASCRGEETIHPYYDDFNDEVWIKAKLVDEIPVSFEFYTEKPKRWDETKYCRAKTHFKKFSLNKLYKPYASEMFIGAFSRLKRLYDRTDEQETKNEVKECIKDEQKHGLNSWQSVMYSSIYESDWFWSTYIRRNEL